MNDLAINVQHLTKRFGHETVLEDVSLSLEQGNIHGIIGRNGSGKTVLMKCICGFLRPTSGTVQVWGKRIGINCDFAPHTGMLIETLLFWANQRRPVTSSTEPSGMDAGSRTVLSFFATRTKPISLFT